MSLSIIGFISFPPIENGRANWQFARFSRKVASKESRQTASLPYPRAAIFIFCASQCDMLNSCGKSTRRRAEDCDPLPAIPHLRSSIFVTGGLVNFLLSDVEFCADDAHRQHHLFFRAFALGDFGQPPPLTFAAMMDAETCDDHQNGHCARHRPFHLRRLKKLRESSQPTRFLPRLFPLLQLGDARHHVIGEIVRRLFAAKRMFQFIIKMVHAFISPKDRVTFSLKITSDRRRWLLTVFSGMPSNSAISVGSRSSW